MVHSISSSPSPVELGLPAKFSSFRDEVLQFQTACDIATSLTNRRFALLSAPPGSGKTLIDTTVAQLLSMQSANPSMFRTLFLTRTRPLQQQRTDDFSSMGLIDIRGKGNYRCIADDTDCSKGRCNFRISCEYRMGGCEYYDRERAARNSSMVSSNYAKWLADGKYRSRDGYEPLNEFDLLVCDEAHNIPDLLTEFVSIIVYQQFIQQYALPLFYEPFNEWASECYRLLMDSRRNSPPSDPKETLVIDQLLSDLSYIGGIDSGSIGEWIVDRSLTQIKFTPLWPGEFTEQYLFRGIPHVLLSSATLLPSIVNYLNIEEFAYHEVDSGFLASNRPFIYVPTARMDQRTISRAPAQFYRAVATVDQIIDGRLDRKGVIHTGSYQRAKDFIAKSKHQSIIITHRSAFDLQRALDYFLRCPPPKVFVSPSIEEGVDLANDLCRYQIILKVPYLPPDPLNSARSKSNPQYRYYVPALKITQMYGRVVRGADDWAETFIIDKHWGYFQDQHREYFARWFQHAWKVEKVVPIAMSR